MYLKGKSRWRSRITWNTEVVILDGCIRSWCSYFPLSYMVIFFFKGIFWIKASQSGDYGTKLNMKVFSVEDQPLACQQVLEG